jgi:hypothetical protein
LVINVANVVSSFTLRGVPAGRDRFVWASVGIAIANAPSRTTSLFIYASYKFVNSKNSLNLQFPGCFKKRLQRSPIKLIASTVKVADNPAAIDE